MTVAVVTGAGSGIGRAIAKSLVEMGFHVIGIGRRESLLDVAAQDGWVPQRLDITDGKAVTKFFAGLDICDIVINNAGGAFDNTTIETGSIDVWRKTYEVNVLGTLSVIKNALPLLKKSPKATIITITSVAGMVSYPKGGSYCSAKHAEVALAEVLRLELLGTHIRTIDIAPGMVATEEFSLTRYDGDEQAARLVYEDVDHPLLAEDIATIVRLTLQLPQHVNIEKLVVRPVAQAAQHALFRGKINWRE